MTSPITEAQYILDHPLEHVHPEGYRESIRDLLVIINELRSAGQHVLDCTDQKYMHKKVRDLLAEAVGNATLPVPPGYTRIAYIRGYLEPTEHEMEQHALSLRFLALLNG